MTKADLAAIRTVIFVLKTMTPSTSRDEQRMEGILRLLEQVEGRLETWIEKRYERRRTRREKRKAQNEQMREAQRVERGSRCTYHTLRALGIEGRCPTHQVGMLACLRSEFTVTPVTISRRQTSLAEFIAAHPEGRYYLASSKHAMALVDGKLTDTARYRALNRVRLLAAYQITDKEESTNA